MLAVGALNHPNVIQALDGGEADGRPFLVMELADGLDLHRLSVRRGPLAVADACELIRQAALGLQHVHEGGLVHRDVKPSNLFLTADGVVKVLDLGLARPRAVPPDPEAGPITAPGQVMGTADFMAPEQGQDAQVADLRSDLYSLGCAFYKLLAGHAPFERPDLPTPTHKLRAHAGQDAPPLERTDLPAEVGALLRCLLARDPAERPATAAEVATALEPFAAGADLPDLVRHARRVPSGGTTVATPRPAAPSTRIAPHRRRVRWGVGAVVLLAVLVPLSWLGWQAAFPVKQVDAEPQNVNQESPVPRLRDRWEFGRQNHLLQHSPFSADRDPTLRNTHLQFLPDREELIVNTDNVVLVPLGRVQRVDYRLQVNIRQNTWTGGTGVYFGYRDAVVDGKPGKQFFTITLERSPSNKLQASFQLLWSRHQEPDRLGNSRIDQLRAVPLRLPPPETSLEINVTQNGVKEVRWDGAPLPDLVKLHPNVGRLAAADFDGTFGLYNVHSSTMYRNANLLVFERNVP